MGKRKIALFDIDGTIYEGSVIYPLAEYQLREKTINKNCLDELYKDLELYRAGKIDYETRIAELLIHWAKGLKGISYDTVLEQTRRFFESEGNRFFPFLLTIEWMVKSSRFRYLFMVSPIQNVS